MQFITLLRRRSIGLLWSGLALSAIGDQLYTVALSWIAVDIFGPAAGYIAAIKSAIILAVLFFGGAMSDGWDRRRTMIVADLCRCAVLVLVVLVWMIERQPDAWVLALAVAVLAAGEAFFLPALQTILPQLVVNEPGLLAGTNALLDATNRLARLLGPGLIALAGAIIAPIHFFTANALSFLLSAAAIMGLPPSSTPARSSAAQQPKHPFASLLHGYRTMHTQPLLGFLLDSNAFIGGAWYVAFFLAVPLIISSQFDASLTTGFGLYGLVIAAFGVSNLIANLIVGNRPMPEHPARMILLGVCATGTGILLMALAVLVPMRPHWQLGAFVLASGLSGFGGPFKDVAFATLRQTLLPAADIAPATRTYIVTTHAGMLFGMLVAPMMSRSVSPSDLLLICGGIYLAVAVIGWLRFSR
ncbi:MFS transporter [Phyllobacterium myrsinacearum]|uniref:MFS family permease n=1 Tax=Phyllobacterium myrsinacearum TaxID=28101 RepID=A0A839EB03_9HYPH|nr:MFS transporter [Phyllobacterium myrsinacearum]MBA8877051.1 MFS family permease [Phyllobacterium myrsinacearum]